MPKTLHFEICWTWWDENPSFIIALILQCNSEDIFKEVLRDHLTPLYFLLWTFSHHLCSFFNHIVPSEYTRSSRKNEKSKRVFKDTRFRAHENRFTFLLSGWRWPCTAGRPWAEGLREWEREEAKLQLWCKLNTTQIWYCTMIYVQTSQTIPSPADLIYLYFFKNIFWEKFWGELQMSEASSTQYGLRSICYP